MRFFDAKLKAFRAYASALAFGIVAVALTYSIFNYLIGEPTSLFQIILIGLACGFAGWFTYVFLLRSMKNWV